MSKWFFWGTIVFEIWDTKRFVITFCASFFFIPYTPEWKSSILIFQKLSKLLFWRETQMKGAKKKNVASCADERSLLNFFENPWVNPKFVPWLSQRNPAAYLWETDGSNVCEVTSPSVCGCVDSSGLVFQSFIVPILICKSCLYLSFSWFIIK